ncbi:MAG: hypothetical protein OCD00_03680 [Colwellia sp.]
MPKLIAACINAINQRLPEPIHVSGLINQTNEITRLAFIFDDDANLNSAISQVLFNKSFDTNEELTIKQSNEFNLYRLFFQGIGESYFFFNESALIEDIKKSISLNDYCQRDHAYQQKAFTQEGRNYISKGYEFSCDYWIRYINKNNELVYATVRSADMDLYWQLEELSQQLIEQAIPHTIDMNELEVENDEGTTPFDIVVDANGKEQQLNQLQVFCRKVINELIQDYRDKVASDEPACTISTEIDECTEQYFIFVINNEQAAKKVHFRDFERSVAKIKLPRQNFNQQYKTVLHTFKCLFEDKLKLFNQVDNNNEVSIYE